MTTASGAVVDLRWLNPLPLEAVRTHAAACGAGAGRRRVPGDRRRGRRCHHRRPRRATSVAGASHRSGRSSGAQSLRRRLCQLRRPQQRDAVPLPRHLRLRLRVRQRDAVLSVGPLRRDAAARRRALRPDHGGDAADARRGAPGDLQPLPADLAEVWPRALRPDEACRRQGRHDHLRRREAPKSRSPSPAARSSCNGSRISACAGQRLASISKCSARTTRPTRRSTTASATSSAAAPRSISSTNCSSTRTARRYRSRRATG